MAKLQFSSEELANGRFRDVIGSRAEAARHQNQVGIHAGVERIEDGLFGIADGQRGIQLKTMCGKLFAKPSRIGVNHLTDKQFVADGDVFYNDLTHISDFPQN